MPSLPACYLYLGHYLMLIWEVLDPGLTIFSQLVTMQSDSMIQSLTDDIAHRANKYKL